MKEDVYKITVRMASYGMLAPSEIEMDRDIMEMLKKTYPNFAIQVNATKGDAK